jgi:hypothetical protein
VIYFDITAKKNADLAMQKLQKKKIGEKNETQRVLNFSYE